MRTGTWAHRYSLTKSREDALNVRLRLGHYCGGNGMRIKRCEEKKRKRYNCRECGREMSSKLEVVRPMKQMSCNKSHSSDWPQARDALEYTANDEQTNRETLDHAINSSHIRPNEGRGVNCQTRLDQREGKLVRQMCTIRARRCGEAARVMLKKLVRQLRRRRFG